MKFWFHRIWKHPLRLWPRGRLDIGWNDLLFAALAPLLTGARPRRVWPTELPHIATFSVRTAWDALLMVKAWPQGSEIIISEANIVDMVSLIEAHGLVPVVARLNPSTLSVDINQVQNLITDKTRAILISPLFGSRIDLTELGKLARKHNLLLVEDNAQGFRGTGYTGSPEADVTMFSFGLIKTRTSLSGAVIFARDPQLLETINAQVSVYPRISTNAFYLKLARAVSLHILSQPLIFGLFWRILNRKDINPDVWLSQATRGMSGMDLLTAVRRQPHSATLKLLRHRLYGDKRYSAKTERLCLRGKNATQTLDGALGKDAADSVFWALPISIANRESLIEIAHEAGFDLSFRASNLISHSETETPFSLALDKVVFLPIASDLPNREWNRLMKIVRDFERDNNPVTT